MQFREVISVFLILFSVIDILGSIPILIDMKKKGIKIEALRATAVSFVLMTLFLIVGKSLLGLFGVDVESFAVAGALVIFLMGIEMILGIEIFKQEPEGVSGSVVPIAFPLIAGAGSLTTILSLRAKYDALTIEAAIFLNMIVVYFVLRSATWLSKKLGRGGANVLRKVFGIILLAIATKLFRDNFHFVVQLSPQ